MPDNAQSVVFNDNDKICGNFTTTGNNTNVKRSIESIEYDGFKEQEIEKLTIENETLRGDRKMRGVLMARLYRVSLLWLVFTGIVVLLLGADCICFHLDTPVAIAFITTSLSIVLGAWIIGLRYFFHRKP
ncbi:MAG: hypothetical protein LBB88_08460 [Planctomycetaceae bacterium]|jgi:hypothetical protein|nr:hypothetical protein [Planctomycetaceae bacterium]